METPTIRPPSTVSSMPMYHSTQPIAIENPHNNDVLCGRGVTTNRHVGNESFRSLVNCNKELYVSSTKKAKMKISRSIVEAVRSLEPPGRFLEKDPQSGKWFDIGDKKAVEKTSQALRDGAAHLRKQLSEDLCDPDFLSAVFDMDVVPSDKKVALKKQEKKLPVKSHRRTKSNPTVLAGVKSKTLVIKKNSVRNLEAPMSPRSHQASIGKQPSSPVMSPRSSGGSPRPSMQVISMSGAAHRRAHSQGSMPLHVSCSPVSFARVSSPRGHLTRRTSYDYPENAERSRPPPSPYGSPRPHYPPPPMSPSGHLGSPYGHAYHHPPSPQFSPRNAYPSRAYPSPKISPHPFLHPSDFHGRASPDRRALPPPPVSPHGQFARPNPHYPRHGNSYQQSGYNQNHLSVPSLGGEQSHHYQHPRRLPTSPGPQQYHHPSSPSQAVSPLPVDFAPPQTFSPRKMTPYNSNGHNHVHGHHAYGRISERCSAMEEEYDNDGNDEKKGEEHCDVNSLDDEHQYRNRVEHDRSSLCEVIHSSSSPSAVVDVIKSDESNEKNDHGYAGGYLSDDDPNPAVADCNDADSLSCSPLPFEGSEGPDALMMDLPENILSLPISPCGPGDDEGEI